MKKSLPSVLSTFFSWLFARVLFLLSLVIFLLFQSLTVSAILRCPSIKEKVLQINSSVVLDSDSHPIILSTSLPAGVLACIFSRTISIPRTRTNLIDEEYAGTLARIVPGGEWITHSRVLQKALRKKIGSDGDEDRTQFWDCNNSRCSIPYLPSDLNNDWDTSSYKYFLISINYNLRDGLSLANANTILDNSNTVLDNENTVKKHVSRFFDRSTFGPTRKSLNTFISKYGKGVRDVNSLNDAYAVWIADQIDPKVTPWTSHRAYFRRRADKYMPNMILDGTNTKADLEFFEEQSTRPTHPCEPFSRWRKFTFTEDDRRPGGPATVTVKHNGLYELYVNGQLRTTTRTLSGRNGGKMYKLEPGEYKLFINDASYDEGGNPSIPRNTTSRTLRILSSARLYLAGGNKNYNIKEGNMPIKIPSNFFKKNDPVQPFMIIRLPHQNQFKKMQFTLSGGGVLVYPRKIKRAICKEIPLEGLSIPNSVIGIFPNGEQVMYDPRIQILDNTPNNILQDGGGDEMNLGKFCSTAPRTFINEHTCRMSESPLACGTNPQITRKKIRLQTNSVLDIYRQTGRYIYIVEGLRFEKKTQLHPCMKNRRSRWKTLDHFSKAQCLDRSIDARTRKFLAHIINQDECNLYCGRQDAERADNKKYRDIWIKGKYATRLETKNHYCNVVNAKVMGATIWSGNKCFINTHPNEGDIRDMTYWTGADTHPGNTPDRNPIKEFHDLHKTSILSYPNHHTMDRWANNIKWFNYLGKEDDLLWFHDLPTYITNIYGKSVRERGKGVVVCASQNEVAKNPLMPNSIFEWKLRGRPNYKSEISIQNQKKSVWRMIALKSPDQLRQRIAWALSQILVVSERNLIHENLTEGFLNYYDIFVRNAFGNYRNILKEVSYNPLMSKMLSYLDSQSSLYTRQKTSKTIFPDENFAREIMQLFSIGTVLLHIDGTEKIDATTGRPIHTYTNNHIMSFARAWTGFRTQMPRANIEGEEVDPLLIDPIKRDIFPKISLDMNFIGDGLPLCNDLPEKHFLKKKSLYRLLGSVSTPEMLHEKKYWTKKPTTFRLVLDKFHSHLYKVLNNFSVSKVPGTNIFLKNDLKCFGNECSVDTLKQVEVNGIFYEYVRPPCVHLSFFENSRSIRKRNGHTMCENESNIIAASACSKVNAKNLTKPINQKAMDFCKYSGELLTYRSGSSRCRFKWTHKLVKGEHEFSDWSDIDTYPKGCVHDDYWHWSPRNCTLTAKVFGENGNIAVVHEPKMNHRSTNTDFPVWPEFSIENLNYFPVYWWEKRYPSPKNECGEQACTITHDGMGCLCQVVVVETAVFDKNPRSVDDVLSNLKIGSFEPSILDHLSFDGEFQDVRVYHSKNGIPFDTGTVFGVKIHGNVKYFKNVLSKVKVAKNSKYYFRNPPKFYSYRDVDMEVSRRDAVYETDALLDHLFYHKNTAPFISNLLLQRLGVSNPSPNYVKNVATAFCKGLFQWHGPTGKIVFGKGSYGDLASTVSAILLDLEFLTVPLDADPSTGSMKEPLLKLMGFLRALEYDAATFMPELRMYDLERKLGQEAHAAPSVFSYFLSNFSPPGPLFTSSLYAPEAQIQTPPTIIDSINGMLSFIEFGLVDCSGGFGSFSWFIRPRCPKNGTQKWTTRVKRIVANGVSKYNPSSLNAEELVDELDTLLLNGRLNQKSRKIIVASVLKAKNFEQGLHIAQKLIITTPEYHTTSIVMNSSGNRPQIKAPPVPKKRYKALVHIMLNGGADSFNMLVPYSGCSSTTSYSEYSRIRGIAAVLQSNLLRVGAGHPQPCKQYGINNGLRYLYQLYNQQDLLFVAGIGMLIGPTGKNNWEDLYAGKVHLFAHDKQQTNIEQVDVFQKYAGTGIGGRIADVLQNTGYESVTLSVGGVSEFLVGDIPVVFLNPISGIQLLHPLSYETSINYNTVLDLNGPTTLWSGLFSETWSRMVYKTLSHSETFNSALNSVEITTIFPNTSLGNQMKAIAHLIKTRTTRRTERDILYATSEGWDMHLDLGNRLKELFAELNGALRSFVIEMKKQNIWNDIVVVQTSEFGRTTTPNTSGGTDHAWSGNCFLAGGMVKGGQVLGTYPDISEGAPLNIDRGRIIPSHPWESLWSPIAQFLGVRPKDMNAILPNRARFPDDQILKFETVFK